MKKILNFKVKTNLSELQELVEEVQRDAERLKRNFEKLNNFEIKVDLNEQDQN